MRKLVQALGPALAALTLLLLVASPAYATATPRSARTATGMVRLPAGRYVPLYGGAGTAPVGAFRLDREPVTRGEFLAFVRAHAEWRRSTVETTMAEHGYLADWRGDLDAGRESLEQPVTQISWHAARAYCAARGARLPTTDEWEYAAAASETSRDASRDPSFTRRLVALYGARSARAPRDVGSTFRNVYGVADLHGLVWEWTLDFDGAMPDETSHSRHAKHHADCASAAIGASDATNYPAFLRAAVRAGLDRRSAVGSLGFRCAAA